VTESKSARHSRRWLPWAAAGAALVVGGAVSGVIVAATSSSAFGATSGSATAVSACAVTPVADQVLSSVVTIAASGRGGSGTGSGEVIRSDGYILTNNHVISVAAHGGAVDVLLSDGQTEPATITGRDVQTDLAVLHVQPACELKVIALGSSASVKVGQPVVALGAPLGLSGTTVADEIIATGRVTHAFFGLSTVPIPPAAAAQAGVPDGLFVQAVTPGGPAAQAGLQANDVITTINGEPATSNIQLQELTLTRKPGDPVSIGSSRDGQSATTMVTLGAQP
jgi:S1-C subfamily serine protease